MAGEMNLYWQMYCICRGLHSTAGRLGAVHARFGLICVLQLLLACKRLWYWLVALSAGQYGRGL